MRVRRRRRRRRSDPRPAVFVQDFFSLLNRGILLLVAATCVRHGDLSLEVEEGRAE